MRREFCRVILILARASRERREVRYTSGQREISTRYLAMNDGDQNDPQLKMRGKVWSVRFQFQRILREVG
jgi:hypothetical protein